jgi:hypothetical protein
VPEFDEADVDPLVRNATGSLLDNSQDVGVFGSDAIGCVLPREEYP